MFGNGVLIGMTVPTTVNLQLGTPQGQMPADYGYGEEVIGVEIAILFESLLASLTVALPLIEVYTSVSVVFQD